jgi:ADP-ribose pyrophosphatase YjhB (NUDIX family)
MKKILLDAKAIKELLEKFKTQGYDRIDTPGGTDKDGRHYSGVFVFDYDEESKKIGFVGVPYASKHFLTEKGKQSSNHTKQDNETPKETARREVFEETGLKVDNLDDLIEVFQFSVPDNLPGRPEGSVHTKYYFVVDARKCSGELHTFEGENPIDAETMAPEIFVGSQFELIFNKKKREPLQKAFEYIRGLSYELYQAL